MTRSIGFVLLLAVAWCLLWGSAMPYVVASGLLVGAAVSFLVVRAVGATPTVRLRWMTLPKFACYFVKILVMSNIQVLRVVLRPGFAHRPRIVRIDVGDMTPMQTTTLASVITLTPGTLSLDISDDGRWLSVHCMIGEDREAVERDLLDIKRRLLSEVFR